MDYQVDHSSYVYEPSVNFVVAAGGTRSWDSQFYFASGSVDAVPILRRLAGSGSTAANKEVRKLGSLRVASPSSEDASKALLVSARLNYIYCNDAAAQIDPSQSRIALRGVVEAVDDLVGAGDYLALDSLLAGVDPKQLRPITNVAFLRSAFQVKDKLSNWKPLYQVVYAHLANSGQDPARALRGLSASRASNFA